MTTMRRSIRAIALAAATTLALAACTGNGNEAEEVSADDLQDQMVGAMEDYGPGVTFRASEPVSFSLMYRDHPNYPIQDDWRVLTALEENQNVTFDIVNVPLADWADRRALVIAAGDAPDMVPSTHIRDAKNYTAGGALLPVGNYLDLLPNFQQKIGDWGLQDELDAMAYEGDGSLYILPGLFELPKPEYTIAIRGDLWDAAGLTEDPATWDEFQEQLQIVADANPDLTYAYTERWNLNGVMMATLQAAAPNFGTNAGWGYSEGVTYDWDAEEYVYTGATDEYRDLIGYFAGLVADGLLDPESVSQDDDTAIAKFTSGEVAAIGVNDQEILTYRSTMEESGMDVDVRQIVVPAGPAGNNLAGGMRFESGIVFTSEVAEKDDFVAMMQFVDWLYYSDEGLEFAKWGVEGETFTKDADGNRTLTENVDINGLNPGAPEMLNADYGFHNGVFMLAHGSTNDLVQSMLRDEVREWMDKMHEKDILPVPPGIHYDDAQLEQAVLLRTPLEDATQQTTGMFITGQRSMDEWDQHVAELEARGVQQYVDLVNEAVSN